MKLLDNKKLDKTVGFIISPVGSGRSSAGRINVNEQINTDQVSSGLYSSIGDSVSASKVSFSNVNTVISAALLSALKKVPHGSRPILEHSLDLIRAWSPHTKYGTMLVNVALAMMASESAFNPSAFLYHRYTHVAGLLQIQNSYAKLLALQYKKEFASLNRMATKELRRLVATYPSARDHVVYGLLPNYMISAPDRDSIVDPPIQCIFNGLAMRDGTAMILRGFKWSGSSWTANSKVVNRFALESAALEPFLYDYEVGFQALSSVVHLNGAGILFSKTTRPSDDTFKRLAIDVSRYLAITRDPKLTQYIRQNILI